MLRHDDMTAAPFPPFTAEHEDFRQAVRGWVLRELRPHAGEWEDARWFPDNAFRAIAAQGYIGLALPRADGGDGDPIAAAVFAEELQRCGSGGVAAGLGAHAHIALPPIAHFGTEDQRRRYLVPGLAGEAIAALGISEPNAGSDVAAIRTHAQRVDGGFVVNGSKMFITNGVRADLVVMAVRTRPEGGHDGISFLIVDTDQPGYEASKIEKLGWHASDTALIALDDVFVPAENLLGTEHEGFKLIMANFQWERLIMAVGAVGAMAEALELAVGYAGQRIAFGRPIGRHQAIRHRLADMATSLHTCRCVTYDALRRFADGEDVRREVTMAKLLTQRAAYELIDDCLQIHGGAGYMREYEVERMARDARLGPIGGGSDEIMREILGKSLGI
jgi:acyl-CoA dehydrogenase